MKIMSDPEGRWCVWNADCLTVLRRLSDASVDAVVTDPPYGLEFMGKDWDAPWKQSGTVLDDPAEVGGFQDGAGGNPYSRSRIRYGRDGDSMHAFQSWFHEIAVELLRVLKPGGHLLAFGGTRTYHRMACAIEDAGFEIRDSIHWVYGSGFPKSLDVSKAIDKQRDDRADIYKVTAWIREARDRAGISNKEIDAAFGFAGMAGHWTSGKSQPSVPTLDQVPTLLEVLGVTADEVPEDIRRLLWDLNGRKGQPGENWWKREVVGTKTSGIANKDEGPRHTIGASKAVQVDITTSATDAAREWEGWGTALKPAHEPIVLARKPLIGTVAANVLEHGTGALNIDGTRVPTDDPMPIAGGERVTTNEIYGKGLGVSSGRSAELGGRWPANLVHDGSDEVTARFPDSNGGAFPQKGNTPTGQHYEGGWGAVDNGVRTEMGSGSAARFFTAAPFDDADAASFLYCAKPGKKERNAGLEGLPKKPAPKLDGGPFVSPTGNDSTKVMAHNFHPTVKPLALMRWLVRLVTPPNGIVLDPFSGSGTTLVAALLEGKQAWGCEMTEEYLDIIEGRIGWAIEQIETTIEGTR